MESKHTIGILGQIRAFNTIIHTSDGMWKNLAEIYCDLTSSPTLAFMSVKQYKWTLNELEKLV